MQKRDELIKELGCDELEFEKTRLYKDGDKKMLDLIEDMQFYDCR